MSVDTNNKRADARDADYLMCQLNTNHAVIHFRARMQQALDNLHQVYLDVSEEVVDPPSVRILVPRIDTTSSRPRSATPTVAQAEELTRSLAQARSKR